MIIPVINTTIRHTEVPGEYSGDHHCRVMLIESLRRSASSYILHKIPTVISTAIATVISIVIATGLAIYCPIPLLLFCGYHLNNPQKMFLFQ